MRIETYSSLDSIEEEFATHLNELLKEHTPNLKSTLTLDDSESLHLFFDEHQNSPVGILKESTEQIQGLIFKKSIKKFCGVSSYHSSATLDRRYLAQASFLLDANLLSSPSALKLEGLVKNAASYEEYFSALDKKTQQRLKELFLIFKDFQINSYKSIKDAFSYRKESIADYKNLKKMISSKQLELLGITTLNSEDKVLAYCILYKGFGAHCFYQLFNHEEYITDEILLQMAVMAFYQEDCNYLHPLEVTDFLTIHKSYLFGSINEQILQH